MCQCVCISASPPSVIWFSKKVFIHLFSNVSYTNRLRYAFQTRLLRKLPTLGVVEFWGLTLILLMWRIGWVPNNTSKWQMGFNSAFKGLTTIVVAPEQREFRCRKCVISMVQNTICPTFGSTTYRHFRPELKAAVLLHMFHAAQCEYQYKCKGYTDNIIS
jgi:hypothetical protein